MQILLSVFLFFMGLSENQRQKQNWSEGVLVQQAQVPNIELTVYMVYKNEQ